MTACPTALLVDITGESSSVTKQIQQSPKSDANPAGVELPDSLKQGANIQTNDVVKTKLCGYLSKITSIGLIKTSKVRWFQYDPSSCQLVYSRSPDIPTSILGKIHLSHASLNFSAAEVHENMFTITTDTGTHTMQARDRKTLLWWLQELQSERRQFNRQHSRGTISKPDWEGQVLGSSVFWVKHDNYSNNLQGLLDVNDKKSLAADVDRGGDEWKPPAMLVTPPDNVGEQATNLPKSRSMSSTSFAALSNRIPNFNAAIHNAGEAIKGLKTTGSRFKVSPTAVRTHESKASCDHEDEEKRKDRVRDLERTIGDLKQEMELMETKLQSREESIQLLKLELESKDGNFGDAARHEEGEGGRALRDHVIRLNVEKERLARERDEEAESKRALAEQVGALRETLVAKDHAVVELNNRICDLEAKLNSLDEQHDKLKQEQGEEFVMVAPPDDHISSLRDQVSGYVVQNQFLNNEILELTDLRRLDADRIHGLREKVDQKEAEHCQLHSKYLILLSELNRPRSDSVGLAVHGMSRLADPDDRRDVVKLLIQEAIDDADARGAAHRSSSARSSSSSKYDQFGFSTLLEDEQESSLLQVAGQQQKRATDIINSLSEHSASVAVKWQNYIAVNRELQRCDDLKALIRLGIPHELRPQLWSWMVTERTMSIQQQNNPSSNYYKWLQSQKVAQLLSKQIELDLLRTLPNNKHFASVSSDGIEPLRRILQAYSIHNPTIGYCQGMNRVVAVALLYLCEEDAFWCLVAIVECIMPPGYYSNTLTASQADQRVFRDLMAEKLPRLHKHLETNNVDTSLITFNWLLCVFCDNLPPETMLHIWDVYLYEGSKVLFRFGLAFFKSIEEELLQLNDYITLFHCLKRMPHRMFDVRSLTNSAFNLINPFPMRKIERLRAAHVDKVEAELRELDAIRRGFSSVRRCGGGDTRASSRRHDDSDEN